jgi:hypothetical protein
MSGAAYFMLECFSPDEADHAQFSYEPDDDDRSWTTGRKFASDPPLPVPVSIEPGEGGVLPELTDVPLPLMSRRLADCLTAAGVANIDYYPVEVVDVESGRKITDLVSFNLIGLVAAADLAASGAVAPDGPLISVDFDGVVLDPLKARGAQMFRLAEAVSAIVVHERIKQVIEAAGIDTLTFVPPEEWVG